MCASNNYCYLSVLTTDSYLEGVLVLYHSLKSSNPKYPFCLLISDDISEASRELLTRYGIQQKLVRNAVANPTSIEKSHNWAFTYSKLDIFGRTEFKKIVYLDADMLILRNIDELFDKPHMSAVNAGGMIPDFSHWVHLNSGLMVVEPSDELYQDMIQKVGKIEKVESGGDQDFLHAYYPNWANEKHLHLDHQYNIFNCHLDEYKKLGYLIEGEGKLVKVIHYIGSVKPWQLNMKNFISPYSSTKRMIKKVIRSIGLYRYKNELSIDATIIWIKYFQELKSIIPKLS